MQCPSAIELTLFKEYKDTNESLAKISRRLGIKYAKALELIWKRFDSKFISERNKRVFKVGMRNFSDEQGYKLLKAYSETNESLQKIAKRLGIGYGSAHKYVASHFNKEYMRNRHFTTLSKSTKGIPNGRTKEKHPRYTGGRHLQKFKDSKEPYWMVMKPEWYTGAKNTRYIPEHVVIACKAMNITELPKALVVHHCDQNHFNNDFGNLVIMPKSAHSSLHAKLKKESVSTMEKSSTLKWLAEARGFVLSEWLGTNDEIVISGQECPAANSVGG